MVIAVIGTTFSKAVVQLDYNINQNYIASTLCENRNKPACCCHGKCFLKKQMQKDEDPGKNNVPVSKDKFDVSLFCEAVSTNDFNNSIPDKLFSDHYLVKKYTALLSPVFHPPGKA
jgi:hypothetical protein